MQVLQPAASTAGDAAPTKFIWLRIYFIGGDPYLLVLKGFTYRAEGAPDADRLAGQAFQTAIDREPDLDAAWWGLTLLSLDAKQYDKTVQLLAAMQTRFHANTAELTKAPPFAEFVQSATYRNWVAAQKKDASKN